MTHRRFGRKSRRPVKPTLRYSALKTGHGRYFWHDGDPKTGCQGKTGVMKKHTERLWRELRLPAEASSFRAAAGELDGLGCKEEEWAAVPRERRANLVTHCMKHLTAVLSNKGFSTEHSPCLFQENAPHLEPFIFCFHTLLQNCYE